MARPRNRELLVALMFIVAFFILMFVPHLWKQIPSSWKEMLPYDVFNHAAMGLALLLVLHLLRESLISRGISSTTEIQRKELQAALADQDERQAAAFKAANNELIVDLKKQEAGVQADRHLLNTAAQCGLERIYLSRSEALPDISKAIQNAKTRITILGIAVSEKLRVGSHDLIVTLSKKKASGCEVKILLLDPLSISAIIRTLFESHPDDAEKLLHKDRTSRRQHRQGDEDPYFTQALYRDVGHAFAAILCESNLHSSLRFYHHSPTFWLVLVDDVLFFQPYTFGRSKDYPKDNLLLCDYMPVMRFGKRLESATFDILADHVEKLWLTSNVHTQYHKHRLANSARILAERFRRHRHWCEHIYSALYAGMTDVPRSVDRRTFPRRACELKPTPVFSISLVESLQSIATARIRDYTPIGLGLELQSGAAPMKGQEVMLNLVDPDSRTSRERTLLNDVLGSGHFIVAHVQDSTEAVIGLAKKQDQTHK
jgi:hypothetical protein